MALKITALLSKIIPSCQYEMSTAMRKETILKTVQSNTGSYLAGNDFYGTTKENKFQITPYSKWNRKYQSIRIDATIAEKDEGSLVSISIHYDLITSIILWILIGVLTFCVFTDLFLALISWNAKHLLSALPLFCLLIGIEFFLTFCCQPCCH